ncbi:muconolactone Delta-isomerase family protein [Paractinoplanes atraurantiacus]|uniref:Muconolactone delta-isomerase n=1 Tax=Paractinoplanes atraurantiacus TaxID=1036182 RepID=A0A285JR15_9ACTN|nr:muconolactone Delta-isomerase family protein [Actinoplanes atraurantiacus]SNY62755.1 muconolactone delta-isomerase [Actinoplanes atraurantiacus]
MEYLVTMTTTVPAGTTADEVADMRAREALNTSRLADQGKVLRLWRPPLGPGEWRSIGLFAAGDPDELEAVLATMPLRAWRTDEVTPLGAFPGDPGPGRVEFEPGAKEFLVKFKVEVPGGTRREAAGERFGHEGRLVRLWTVPGGRGVGLWQTTGDDRPIEGRLTIETVPLTPHPSDPATLAAAR